MRNRQSLIIAADAQHLRLTAHLGEMSVVPLTPAAAWEAISTHRKIVVPRVGRDFVSQIRLQNQRNHLLKRALEFADIDYADIAFHSIQTLAANAALWTHYIEASIDQAQPDVVFLPPETYCCCRQRVSLSLQDLESYRRFVLHQLVSAVALSQAKQIRLRYPCMEVVQTKSQLLCNELPADHMQATLQGGQGKLKRLLQIVKKYAMKEWAEVQVEECPGTHADIGQIVLIGQKNKVVEILRFFSKYGGIEYFDISSLYSAIDRPISWNWGTQTAPNTVESNLASFANAIKALRYAVNQNIQDFAAEHEGALITDAQHDPFVRDLIVACNSTHRSIALIPEGCVMKSGRLRIFESDCFRHPGVTRFVLDDYQASQWSKEPLCQRESITGGYFGNTRQGISLWRLSGLAYLLMRFQIQRIKRKRPIIFVSFDVQLDNEELDLGGIPPSSESLLDLVEIVSVLLKKNCIVICKARDPKLCSSVTKFFNNSSLLMTARIDWQTCVSLCDAVLIRDSSIAWEIASEGIHVNIWNFSDYPAHAEEALRGCDERNFHVLNSISDVALWTEEIKLAPTRFPFQGVAPWALKGSAKLPVLYKWLKDTRKN